MSTVRPAPRVWHAQQIDATETEVCVPPDVLRRRGAEAAGADAFFPLLILAIIRANPPRLVSNVQYISRFRGQTRLRAEASYYFTNVVRLTAPTLAERAPLVPLTGLLHAHRGSSAGTGRCRVVPGEHGQELADGCA
jgi:hypothetical protein